ncbi:biotin synthase [Hydrogenophaga sp. NFH-34]|uniref:biotin synthase n=1 Tax=Hydrogenophaga sp. NFH-34 TaxID=2744446 RepID=UPI001F2796D3|nr:biotin synthase [Hydrogenophaga sp. NFH-34]
MPVSEVPGLDALAAHRWLRRPAEGSAWLHEEVARRMMDRLGWFRTLPDSWLHWEPVLGGLRAHAALVERLPQAQALVWAEHLDAALAATGARRPGPAWHPSQWLRRDTRTRAWVPDETVGMLWSNLALHAEPQPQALLRRWQGLIRTDGFLMFSCLGPDTLRELRALYAARGWRPPAQAFTDMHDWGDMLVQSGFAEPVMDMERIVLTYSSGAALLDELRTLGRNLSTDRAPRLQAPGGRAALVEALESGLPRGDDGRLQMTFEIVYGHAYKPVPKDRGTQTVSLDEMRNQLRQRPPR